MRPPPAVRDSMERARHSREFTRRTYGHGKHSHPGPCHGTCPFADARRETRAILEALQAARRSEGALAARWGLAP